MSHSLLPFFNSSQKAHSVHISSPVSRSLFSTCNTKLIQPHLHSNIQVRPEAMSSHYYISGQQHVSILIFTFSSWHSFYAIYKNSTTHHLHLHTENPGGCPWQCSQPPAFIQADAGAFATMERRGSHRRTSERRIREDLHRLQRYRQRVQGA